MRYIHRDPEVRIDPVADPVLSPGATVGVQAAVAEDSRADAWDARILFDDGRSVPISPRAPVPAGGIVQSPLDQRAYEVLTEGRTEPDWGAPR